MKYSDALKMAHANKHLIGKVWNNAVVDEILIAPTNSKERSVFEKRYVQTLDAQESIIPFVNSDVEVVLICNKDMIRTTGLFTYISIEALPKSLNVIMTIK